MSSGRNIMFERTLTSRLVLYKIKQHAAKLTLLKIFELKLPELVTIFKGFQEINLGLTQKPQKLLSPKAPIRAFYDVKRFFQKNMYI